MESAELNGDDVDPEIRQFADAIAAAYAAHGPFDQMSPAEQRRVCEIVRAPWRQGGPVMAVTLELTVDTPRGPGWWLLASTTRFRRNRSSRSR